MNNIIKTDFETIKEHRGEIRKIAKGVDVLNITSKKGSRRADHFHKFSSHLCKLLFGKMLYFERPANSQIKPIKLEINPGDYFYSKNMVEHSMIFLENSNDIYKCS